MTGEKYIGLDVHQATISAAVMDSKGKLVMESFGGGPDPEQGLALAPPFMLPSAHYKDVGVRIASFRS